MAKSGLTWWLIVLIFGLPALIWWALEKDFGDHSS